MKFKEQGNKFTVIAGVGMVLVGALAGGCGSQGGEDATSGQEPAPGTADTNNNTSAGPATGPGATPLVPPADKLPRKGPE